MTAKVLCLMTWLVLCAVIVQGIQGQEGECVDGFCGRRDLADRFDSDTLKGLERAVGSTAPLVQTWQEAPPTLDCLPGKPGPMIAAGPEDAAVIVHFWSDFQCPVCLRAIEPLKYLVTSSPFAGQVRVVFSNYASPSHRHVGDCFPHPGHP